jgi:hypothetical protein
MPTLAVPVINNELPNTPAVPALLINTATLSKLVTVPLPNEVVMEPPKAILPSPPLIVTAPLLVLAFPEARVKLLPLLVNDDPETIDASPPAAPDKSPAITLNAPLILVLEPTEIAMLLSEPDADKPLPIPKAPLSPTLAVPVFINRSSDMPAVPALLVNMMMFPQLVAVPMPNEIVMELPKAVLPLLPSIVTAPPLVMPSPKARVKLLLLLVADNPEMIDASPPAAPNELPAVTLNTPPMSVPELTEIAMLLPKPDADKPLPISRAPLSPTLAVPVFNNRSPQHAHCYCIALQYCHAS